MKKLFIFPLLLSLSATAQKSFVLTSPDQQVAVNISIAEQISYTVKAANKELLGSSVIAFLTDGNVKGGYTVSKSKATSVDQWLLPVVAQKSDSIKDHYNQLRIDFKNGLALEWRAYNNGVAWHWVSNIKNAYQVKEEKLVLGFPKGTTSWYPEEDNFYSHNERLYKYYSLDTIGKRLASLPVLFDVKGTKVLLTESDLYNYAGLWVKGNGNGQVEAVFAHYPKEKKVSSDRDEKVISREDFIAKADGPRSFPWRILMIAQDDKDLLDNQLVYQLGRPATGDYSWVKPGKVQWDWWHYNNVYNVDFRSGINNDTYKYYIDFASRNKIEYVLLDEGWCDTRDLMKQAKEINVPELVAYANKRNVDILLWTSWLVLDKQLDFALDTFAAWGVKGIKVDFMQRDDQQMVEYYEKVSKAAAARKLLVDYHGAYKPVGWLRTYPNTLTSEGVFGNEISKFAGAITPEHTMLLPFIRQAAGPMDFTPGGMINVQQKQFAAVPAEPMTLGTRCNQLAMYVVFESPLQMLCDIPTHYIREPEAMELLSAVPAVWKKTIPLAAKVGDYVAVAREAHNGDWYVGAMTDWTSRDLKLSLGFLPAGEYKMIVWKDGINADKNAKDFKMETITVNNKTELTLNLAKGGGCVARIIKK